MNRKHDANRRGWDAVSPGWQARVEERVDWRRSAEDPTVVLDRRELDLLGPVAGKDVCVLGSGDNLVVFALSGLGARVTSVDFSQAQLDVAATRASELGLGVTFLRADVVDLGALRDEEFDLVYTGGHVAVWVSDLARYYAEACRILRQGGILVVNEYHPFRRVWQDRPERLDLEYRYFERGPHQYDRSGDVPGAPRGSLPSYEFHWTVADYINAILSGGCDLVAIDEFGDRQAWWESAPMTGLPHSLLLAGRRRRTPRSG